MLSMLPGLTKVNWRKTQSKTTFSGLTVHSWALFCQNSSHWFAHSANQSAENTGQVLLCQEQTFSPCPCQQQHFVTQGSPFEDSNHHHADTAQVQPMNREQVMGHATLHWLLKTTWQDQFATGLHSATKPFEHTGQVLLSVRIGFPRPVHSWILVESQE